jgi:hypothetical protein
MELVREEATQALLSVKSNLSSPNPHIPVCRPRKSPRLARECFYVFILETVPSDAPSASSNLTGRSSNSKSGKVVPVLN